MYRVLVCAALLVQCVCGFVIQEEESIDLNKYFSHPRDRSGGISPRIIGGEVVEPHTYPFQAVLIIFANTSLYLCGGSLISDNLVLTAAHCVDMQPDSIVVGLGLHNLSANEPQGLGVLSTDYVIHQNWSSELFRDDIALVRLPQNVTFNEYIQPVKLATGSNQFEDEEGTIIGWGETEAENLSTVLRSVNASVLTNTECANANENYGKVISPSNICTSGAGPVGACFGDSGGPLIVDGVLAGITSFGTGDCTLGLPTAFTRVSKYNDWIEENAAN